MNIAVINTGGTISCVGNPLSPMSAKNFADACRSLLNPIFKQGLPDLQITYIEDLLFPESSFGTLDSTNLQPEDWCLMAGYILEHYPLYDGWVLLHGTDSMDFTGTALPFLLSSFDENGTLTGALSKPVIITGSQVPLFYQNPTTQQLSINFNTDAFQNVCGALAAAQTGIPEVGIYFQNNLFRGNRAVKTNASQFNAFSSPNYPALGQYGIELALHFETVLPPPVSYLVSLDNPDVLAHVQNQLKYIQANINDFPVMQLNAFPAAYAMLPATGFLAKLIESLPDLKLKGLILESYGEGNFPSGNPDNAPKGSIYQALKKISSATDGGVIIVDCTQVVTGIVNDSAYLAGAWLPEVGALSPADMTPMAAFAKLMILLTGADFEGNQWKKDTVKRLFQTNLLGEMLSINKLDSRSNSTLLPGQRIFALDGSATLTNDATAGPVLKDKGGNTLWAAFNTAPSADEMPGRLIMQTDGNLVFYDRYNHPMWATDTGIPSGAPSLLILDGSASDNNELTLKVYNYAACSTTVLLYRH